MLHIVVVFLVASISYAYHYKIEKFTVPVDHFSFSNTDTFQIRYLVNDSYWNKNSGSIFFYTGNEGDIEMFAENSDPKLLGYLTSQQALADYVDLIQYLKGKQLPLPAGKPNPVIAFGGSYGGMLAAWLRMKYPHIVTGAIAASAPILQFTGLVPCEAFYRIITSDFKAASKECSETIRKSWNILKTMGKSDEGRKWLSTAWKTCKMLQSDSDIEDLQSWLTDVYTNLAMQDYPYPTNFLQSLPGYPIQVMCRKLHNSSLPEKPLLQALFQALNVYFNYTGKAACLNFHQSTTPQMGDLGWDYQSCTEMVMPMCSNGVTDMFDKVSWNFTEFSNSCYKKWKIRPQEDLAIKIYGGNDISASSNIVFSNGLLDPWSSGGVLRSVSKTVLAVLIPKGAHHLDLRESNAADPVSVKSARNFHRNSIRKWIYQHYHIGGSIKDQILL